MSSAFAPLPGTTPAARGLFIDLWGTLVERPPSGEARTLDEFRLTAGAADAMFLAHRAGWRLYLVGNVESVAFGHTSDEAWSEIEQHMLQELENAGCVLTRSYLCLDHPNGRGKHRAQSVFQQPNTGAFYHAAHTDELDLERSWLLADSTEDLVSGWRSGMRLAGVRTGLALGDRSFDLEPEFISRDLASALETLRDGNARKAG